MRESRVTGNCHARFGERGRETRLLRDGKVRSAPTPSISQIAAEHGIHPNLLRRWHEIALAGLPSLFSDQEAQAQAAREAERQQKEQELYAEIGRLTTQVAWLKKKVGEFHES